MDGTHRYARVGNRIMNAPAIAPPEIDLVLEHVVTELRAAAGGNLLGVALYGGLAKGRYTPGISDVNLLVVVRDAGLEALEAIAPVLTGARRSSRVSAFVVTPDDLRELARVFPVKLMDIQAAHRVLHGDVGLGAVVVDRAALTHRALQELLNLRLRIRQRGVERGAAPEPLWGALTGDLPKLAITLETLLRARGIAVPADRPGVLRAAARELAVADLMEPLADIHRDASRPGDMEVRAAVTAFLRLLGELARRLAQESGR